MLYLSKGMVVKQSTEQALIVTRCGVDYVLTGIGARLWLNGRFKVSESAGPTDAAHLKKLQDLGLMELAEDGDAASAYHLLVRCIIAPAKLKPVRHPLLPGERWAWQWLSRAGLRLTVGELVKLKSECADPTPELLGRENAQALTMRLYASDVLFDTILDIQMETSPVRDDVVNVILGLLRKKRIILI